MKPNIQKVCSSNERIKQLLDIYEMSQTELCQRTGLNKSAVSNYLKGERLPRQDQLSKIADAFDVSAAWMMGYDVPMTITRPPIVGSKSLHGYHIEINDPVNSIDAYIELFDAAERCSPDQIKVAVDTLRAFSRANERKEES